MSCFILVVIFIITTYLFEQGHSVKLNSFSSSSNYFGQHLCQVVRILGLVCSTFPPSTFTRQHPECPASPCKILCQWAHPV